jgi:hypothetical protein
VVKSSTTAVTTSVTYVFAFVTLGCLCISVSTKAFHVDSLQIQPVNYSSTLLTGSWN